MPGRGFPSSAHQGEKSLQEIWVSWVRPATLKESDPVARWCARITFTLSSLPVGIMLPAGSWPHSLNSPATMRRRIFVSGSAGWDRKRNEDACYSSKFYLCLRGVWVAMGQLSHLGLSGAKVKEETAEARVPGPSGSSGPPRSLISFSTC